MPQAALSYNDRKVLDRHAQHMKTLQKKEPRIPFTEEGYEKLLEERKKLLSERPEAVEHLREARAMGDLSENGYYKVSRQRLSFLDSQIRRVERLIRLATIRETRHVTLTDGVKNFDYDIVGDYEANPAKGKISEKSPIGRALTGKKEGDEITVTTPSGMKNFTIVKLT